jgi:hypothetical protein
MKTTKIAPITARSLNFWSALIGDFILAASQLRIALLEPYADGLAASDEKGHEHPGLGPRQRSGGQEQEQTEQGGEGEGVCDHL